MGGMRRCPYCNKDLSSYTLELAEKHKIKCRTRLNPYRYSDRRRGRPSNKEKKEELKRLGRI